MADLKKYLSDPRLPLSLEERQNLAQRYRRAANLPGVKPEQRLEFRRIAHNLVAVGRMRQKLADRNQHSPHPTRQ